MSSDVVIRAEGLGKKYLIGHESSERERYTALRDVVARAARNFARASVDMMRGRAIIVGDAIEEFWALKDVSFEVKRGEVVGIIGRNGAGKSTLLKILSRITEPTEGRVEIRGRMASLLEVGTGFHPELTGRENIYLNGAILGMTRAEIRRKFDEIVAFAEVEKFLDTPVKRYSSGMYVRLAFAVAAYLEPEILVVDEVLSVGDAEFQKKCLGKMGEVASRGRTILFVSHNLKATEHLCTRGMLLEGGRLWGDGTACEAVAQYLRRGASSIAEAASRELDDELDLVALEVSPSMARNREPIEITLEFAVKRECKFQDLHVFIYNSLGDRVAIVDFRDPSAPGGSRSVAANRHIRFLARVERLTLVGGDYRVGFCSRTARHFQAHYDLADLQVFDGVVRNFVPYPAEYQGSILLDYEYAVEYP